MFILCFLSRVVGTVWFAVDSALSLFLSVSVFVSLSLSLSLTVAIALFSSRCCCFCLPAARLLRLRSQRM